MPVSYETRRLQPNLTVNEDIQTASELPVEHRSNLLDRLISFNQTVCTDAFKNLTRLLALINLPAFRKNYGLDISSLSMSSNQLAGAIEIKKLEWLLSANTAEVTDLARALNAVHDQVLAGESLFGHGNDFVSTQNGVVAWQPSHKQLFNTVELFPAHVINDLTIVSFDHHLDIYSAGNPGNKLSKANWTNWVLNNGLARKVVTVGVCPDVHQMRLKLIDGDHDAARYQYLSGANRLAVVDSRNISRVQWDQLIQTKHVLFDVDIDVADANDGCDYSLISVLLALGVNKPFLAAINEYTDYYLRGRTDEIQIINKIVYILQTELAKIPSLPKLTTKSVIRFLKDAQQYCDRTGICRHIPMKTGQTCVGTISEYLPFFDVTGKMGQFTQELIQTYDFVPTSDSIRKKK